MERRITATSRPQSRTNEMIVRRGLTLEQFIQTGEAAAEVHNAQTRRLVGEPANPSPQDLLQLASAHMLERFAMTGVRERFEESLLLCRAVFGWRRLIYRPVNITRRRPPIEEVPAATRMAIEEANSLDRELHRRACVRFEEDLRRHAIGAGEAEALRRASAVYATARRILGFLREAWIETKMAVQRYRVRHGSR